MQIRELGQSEIDQLHLALIGDHDVAGFEIAVNDAGRVRAGQGVGDLDAVLQQLGRLQAAARDHAVQRAARDELHDDEIHAVFVADVVDGDDIGMIQRGRGLGFLHEAQLALARWPPVSGVRTLIATRRLQLRIASLVDDTHAALAQRLDNLVVSNGAANHGAVSPPSLLQELDPGNLAHSTGFTQVKFAASSMLPVPL